MPTTEVFFYAKEGVSPVAAWLAELRRGNAKAYAQCVVRIEQLAAAGHDLRRPAADFLRDGIYELRAKKGRVQYRILYFFHGRQVAILAHAIIKEGAAVPAVDIARAIERKNAYVRDPAGHTLQVEINDGEEEQDTCE